MLSRNYFTPAILSITFRDCFWNDQTMNTPSDSPAKAVTRTGRCLCGGVKFIATGNPINIRACHCQDCQRLTGSAFFARALYPREAVSITGTLAEFKSSDDLARKFCPHCGSQIFAQRKSNNAIAVALGSFDDLMGLQPTEHIWLCDKQPWVIIPPDQKCHQQAGK